MAHGTRVNGASYGITGGKCRVNGTVYDIKKGRTLIGGTGYDITFGPPISSIFSDNDWETIAWACQNNAVPAAWKVGNSKPMTINGASYQIDIIGKNHDTYTAGGTAPLTFKMHDKYKTSYQLRDINSNERGYRVTDMYKTYLPAILSLMPPDVRPYIKSVNKMTSVGAESKTIEAIPCELFLLSEIEVFGSINNSAAGEGRQYEYYSAGGSTDKGTDLWSRSPYINDGESFCYINYFGISYFDDPQNKHNIAFAFCF